MTRLSEEEYQAIIDRRQKPQETPAAPPTLQRRDEEHQEQKTLVQWCDLKGDPYDLLFAIPNGGGRSRAEAGKLKAEGVRAGIPDLMLPVARLSYHGFFLEMKSRTGRLRAEQAEKLERLACNGYYCAVAYGWEEATRLLTQYLTDPESLPKMPVFKQRGARP